MSNAGSGKAKFIEGQKWKFLIGQNVYIQLNILKIEHLVLENVRSQSMHKNY